MIKKYFDLHVTSSYSFGTNSIEEMVKTAEKLNFSTFAIVDMLETKKELDVIKKDISSIKTNINVLVGVEIKANDTTELQNKINLFRDLVDIIVISGGDLNINRAAVENPKVDILAHPEYKRRDSGLDHVMMKSAADNFVAIELNFREYLHTYRKTRSHVLNHMRRNVGLALQFNAPIITTSAAESIWDLRAGRELSSLAYICGLDREQAIKTVTLTPEQIISKVKAVKSPEFIASGVVKK